MIQFLFDHLHLHWSCCSCALTETSGLAHTDSGMVWGIFHIKGHFNIKKSLVYLSAAWKIVEMKAQFIICDVMFSTHVGAQMLSQICRLRLQVAPVEHKAVDRNTLIFPLSSEYILRIISVSLF